MSNTDLEDFTHSPLLGTDASSDHLFPTKFEKDEDDTRADRNSRLSFSSIIAGDHPVNPPMLTIFLLVNSMIGSGILNQPHVFRESGILGGCLGYILAVYTSWFGLLLITFAGMEVNILEYSGLLKYAFGQAGEKMVDLSIIILSVGAELGYIIVIGSTLSELLRSWGCESDVCNNIWMTIIPIVLFVLPVCLFRHFGHLAWLSLFSILAIVAVLLLVLIAGPLHREGHTYDGGDYIVMSPYGTLRSIGSIVFALSCASSNFQAYITTERKSQTKSAWTWITFIVMVLGAIMCAMMGIVGYVSYGNRTEGMILDNFHAHGYDFFKVMIIAHLILYIPTSFVIMRYSMVKFWMSKRSETLPYVTHTSVSVGLLALITGAALLMMSQGLSKGEAFTIILDISGGIGGSLVSLILPGAAYIKLMPPHDKYRWPAAFLILFGFFVMISVVTFTIMDI